MSGQEERDLWADAAWMARCARGSSWPLDMAQRVEDAANRVIAHEAALRATPADDPGEHGNISCPKCGSHDVTCSERPHNHVCHACGYSMLPPQGLPSEVPLMQVDHAQPVQSSPDSGESRSRAAGPESEHADPRRAGAPPHEASSYACERAPRTAPVTSDKRWTVAGDGSWGNPEHLLWPDDQDPDLPHRFTASHMAEAWPNETDSIVDPAHAALVVDVETAARIRSLADIFDNSANRRQVFTGAEVAAMLRHGLPL